MKIKIEEVTHGISAKIMPDGSQIGIFRGEIGWLIISEADGERTEMALGLEEMEFVVGAIRDGLPSLPNASVLAHADENPSNQ